MYVGLRYSSFFCCCWLLLENVLLEWSIMVFWWTKQVWVNSDIMAFEWKHAQAYLNEGIMVSVSGSQSSSFFLCHILLKVISSKTHTSNQFLIACFIQRVEHHCNHNCHVTMPPCRSTLGRHICHITSHTTLAWHMLYFPLMLPSGTTLGLSVSYSPLLLPTNTILREHTLYSPLLLP